jgi:hypothetical protein
VKQVKKPKPLGVCNVCGALTDQVEFVNQRCNKVVYGRRCYGQYKSELTHVWAECETCRASGKVGTQRCEGCEGFGWKLLA